ncbi:MAG: exonuclease domain-containing protein [Patescibacteria group bacterium]
MPKKPFSDNLIFFDTEFSSLDPYRGEILSIGMVKMNGEELYLEIEHKGKVSAWTKENVLPLLNKPKVTRAEAGKRIKKFVGKGSPYLISYIIPFDTLYLYKLFGVNDTVSNRELPFHWIILDFASILFALGQDPEGFRMSNREKFNKKWKLNLKEFHHHHALDDAKILRAAYKTLL